MTHSTVFRTTHVPVGQDQIQHIEFTRECANNFNALHGDVFVEPVALLCAFLVVH